MARVRGTAVQAFSLENVTGANRAREKVTHRTHRKCEEKPMLRQFGKTVGGVLAVLCLVSTVAVAAEMTCTASDGKGNCTAAAGPDGKVVVVVGEGIKVGEKMDCVDKGGVLECIAKR
jgi:hypothetical protein